MLTIFRCLVLASIIQHAPLLSGKHMGSSGERECGVNRGVAARLRGSRQPFLDRVLSAAMPHGALAAACTLLEAI
jgi:hypothetical protein